MDILILAAVAVFLFFKLRSVFGKETGMKKSTGRNKETKDITQEISVHDDNAQKATSNFLIPLQAKTTKEAEVIKTAEDGKEKNALKDAVEDSSLIPESCLDVYKEILKKDERLIASEMISGASEAFENIMDAISTKDVSKIRVTMLPHILIDLATYIQNPTQSVTLAGVQNITIESLTYDKKSLMIKFKIESSQIRFTEEDGVVTSGSKKRYVNIVDSFTFSKSTKNANMPWILESME